MFKVCFNFNVVWRHHTSFPTYPTLNVNCINNFKNYVWHVCILIANALTLGYFSKLFLMKLIFLPIITVYLRQCINSVLFDSVFKNYQCVVGEYGRIVNHVTLLYSHSVIYNYVPPIVIAWKTMSINNGQILVLCFLLIYTLKVVKHFCFLRFV